MRTVFAEHLTCTPCLDEGRLVKATRYSVGTDAAGYRCEKGHTFWHDARLGRVRVEDEAGHEILRGGWSRVVAWPAPPEMRASIDDPGQRAEYERELAQLERSRNIKPSKLVE